MALVALVPVLGCGGEAPAVPDAGTKCLGVPVCEGRSLKACNDGLVGPEIDDCAKEGACSRGRCTSPVCAAAESDRTSFAGCRFYTAQADNVQTDAAAATSYLVTNAGDEPATVTLQQAASSGVWIPPVPTKVAPHATARLSFADLQVDGSGPHDGRGLRIISNRPVTVAQIESDDVNHSAHSSGGTVVLPEHVLGTHYRVMTYSQVQTAAIAALAGNKTGAGRVLIVGTRAGTTVSMTLPDHSSAVIMGSSPSLAPGGKIDSIALGEGDVFQFFSGNEGDDLSGTEIVSDFPIAVFSGNVTTTYGHTVNGINSPDMAHEQMPPMFAWSYQYVAAALPPQAACDTLLGMPGAAPGASIWRVMAANDHTRVDVVGPAGPIRTQPLDAGGVFEMVEVGDLVVTGTGPLLVTQGIDCEPSLSLAISTDQMLEDLTFAVLPFFDQTAAIARPRGATVTLDGYLIDGRLFTAAGEGFEVARVPLPTCTESEVVCTHRLQGRFGMTLRGMDVVASYALTAPTWRGCTDATSCPN